jgi:hypothetical protein
MKEAVSLQADNTLAVQKIAVEAAAAKAPTSVLEQIKKATDPVLAMQLAAPYIQQTAAPKIIGSASSGYYTVNGDGTVTPLGVGGDSGGTGGSDWDKARQFIADNPDASPEVITSSLQENTNLSQSEITGLLNIRPVNITGSENQIASALITSQGGIAEAREFIEGGNIFNYDGRDIKLTEEQKTALLGAIDAQRSFWQRILPWGD